MADPIDLITANPDPSDPDNFEAQADLAWAQLRTAIPQMNAVATAMNLNSTNDTSATTNTIGTGSKTFTVSSGKSFVKGMILNIADTALPSTNYLTAIVTAYSGTSLTVSVLQYTGISGTSVTSWTISMGATPAIPTVTSTLKVTTIAGVGSTNTAVYRFSTTATNTATADITYASSATLGDTFTVLTAGWYRVKGQAIGTTSLPGVGVTINCNELTTIIDSLTNPNQLLARLTQSTSGLTAACDVTVYLAAGDVLRFHDASGSALTTADANCFLQIQKISLQGVGGSSGSNRFGVNVKDHGAVGDGLSDDTTAIQAAITVVEAAGGGTVLLPAGTYLISSSLNIYGDGVYLVGEGPYATEIRTSGTDSVISAIGISSAPINKSGVSKMTIRGGGKDNVNAHGIYFKWGHTCYISDLVIFGCRYAMYFSHQWQTSVRDISVHGAGSDQSYIGMFMDATDLAYIDNAVSAVNVFVQATSGYGFRLINAQGSKFVNCEAGGSPMIHAWYVGDPASGTVKCQWVHATNCLGDSTSSAAWLFRQGTASEIGQMQLSNCWAGNSDSGFYFDGCTNVISDNSLAVGNTKNGIVLNNSSHCKISGGSLIANNEGATAIGDIAIQGGSWNSIVGNTCNSNAIGKSLIESAATDNNTITDNVFIYGATIIGANTVVYRNRGFKTDNRGSAQITAAETSVVVSHQLGITPTVDHIRITPRDNMGSAAKFWVSAADATTFTINVNLAPGATITFGWSIDIVR